MLTNIALTNFRGFRRFAARVGPVTALLGPNSSGKTTVLHAVRMACDLLRYALEADARARLAEEEGATWIIAADGLLIPDAARVFPFSDWQALFVDQVVGAGVALSVVLEFDETDPVQAIRVTVSCAQNQQLKLDVRARADAAVTSVKGLSKKSHFVNQRLTEYLVEHAPLAVLVPPFYGAVREEEYRARAVIDRLLGTGDQSHVVRNLVAGLDATRFDQLNAFLEDTVGAKLTTRTSGDALQSETHLRVTFKDTNGDIELSAAGAGLVNLIALYGALSRWQQAARQRKVVFLLDEPEAHLHPRLQAESTARLSRVVTQEFGAQLLLATHSVDILNRLSLEGAALIRCDRTAAETATTLTTDASLFEDLADWVDLTPYTAINFLASRRIVFCEGADELALLPRLAAVRYRNDAEKLARFRRWAIVALNGASNAPIADLLGRLVGSDAVRAGAKDAAFQVMVALDRDYSRVPGATVTTEGVVTTTQIVWSAHSLESLLLDPTVLTHWVHAHLRDLSPPDVADRVRTALRAADADAVLLDKAAAALTSECVLADVRAGVSLAANGGATIIHATMAARERVAASPATWQRGKDRAAFVLRQLRAGLDARARAQFPTDVCRLFARCDINHIGDVVAAIPVEVNGMLERLVAP